MTDFPKDLTFATLYSGSSGNGVYIEYEGQAILIDAGKNAKHAEMALAEIGGNPKRIKAAFITHEHSDHISALDVLARRYGFDVHAPCGCACACLPACTCYHKEGILLQVGPFLVESFYVPHDSGCCVGYTVTVGGVKLGIATDMGFLAKGVVEKLYGCKAALVECNYDEEMLKNGPYPPQLKARVAGKGGHLSNAEGALLCAVLAYTGAERLLLGHLSLENNQPQKALDAVFAEFEKRGVEAEVQVAKRDEPTVLIGKEACLPCPAASKGEMGC